MGAVPTVLILGHSFVKRLHSDLDACFDPRTNVSFHFNTSVSVTLCGVGGRTVPKLRTYDMHVVRRLKPDVVILEIGTNDLSSTSPEVVGSQIE